MLTQKPIEKSSLNIDEINKKIMPISNIQTEINEKNSNYELGLIEENLGLRDKIDQLEKKCKSLEAQIESSSSASPKKSHSQFETESLKFKNDLKMTLDSIDTKNEPNTEIHPPIRVRLQKLNEKSVALKWNHNQKNFLIELDGYHIYINNELCGTMKATDLIACIDGIQVEGEYRIYIRSFIGDLESANSNEVVTRVKKKANSLKTNDTETQSNIDGTGGSTGDSESDDDDEETTPESLSNNGNKSASNNSPGTNSDKSSKNVVDNSNISNQNQSN